ncbi:MAG: amidohydrolase [Candidatus Cloacimonetes bacterium]|nr:amidohydrolase [Candidatus Cloacimonadota bacterium]
MLEKIRQIADAIINKIIAYQRDFHRFAETGWGEIRTASLIARHLVEMGYELEIGREVIDPESRMGLPSRDDLEKQYHRAIKQGADPEFSGQLRDGFTGIVTQLVNGKGPIIGLRFDMDALGLQEARERKHRPYREGYASVNDGVMHACGHDGHAAAGMGIAEILMQMKDQVRGTVRFIFQPAEEGVRGAKAMVKAGILDDLDYLVGHHVLSSMKCGEIASGMSGYAATSKFDVVIRGKPAHAGGNPQSGNNALLAAANAVLNLYAISRHSNGATRLNVGKLNAGTARNVICPLAVLEIETRGANNELNQYMYKKAENIIKNSVRMYNCEYRIKFMGEAPTADSDPALMELVETCGREIGNLTCRRIHRAGGSEDFTYMMKRVQENDGLAVNIGIGAALQSSDQDNGQELNIPLAAHTSNFDFDEKAIHTAMILVTSLIFKIMDRERK